MTEYVFLDLRVTRVARLSPTMLRVTLGGDRVDDFASGGRDQRFKLFLPHPGQDAPVVPVDAGEDWFGAWRALSPANRAVMRTYTARDQRPGELDVDFALHGESGPASRWALAAQAGDPVTVLAPTSRDNSAIDFRPPPETKRVLLAGDETALPAIGGILAALPAGTAADVWIEVPRADDRQDLASAADVTLTWAVRGEGATLAESVRAADVTVPGYAWIAGESGAVKALRRHLVQTLGVDRRAVKFTGYWRRGASEEDLLAEVVAGGTPHLEE
ncbi:siderophore-interacting protein [Actinomadura flavalba]|uniref:siderophore-interacting protein n=1 Tax=Actinomadura flavalba TaxID=1120938 RepID=UPI00036D966C|nr:siderophore-interacting protein [Actinomadura flavalba]